MITGLLASVVSFSISPSKNFSSMLCSLLFPHNTPYSPPTNKTPPNTLQSHNKINYHNKRSRKKMNRQRVGFEGML